MMDGILTPSKLMAKLQLALTEPEFTLTRWILNRLFLAHDKRGISVLTIITVSTFGRTVTNITVRCQCMSRNRNVDAMGSHRECPALGFDDARLPDQDCLLTDVAHEKKPLLGFKILVYCILRTHHFDYTEAVSYFRKQTSFRKLEGWENGCIPWSKLY